MKKLRTFLAVLVCKAATAFLRILGKGATSLPGGLALKLYPGVLGELAKNVEVVMVTGTNGKTTTSRILEQGFLNAGYDYFCNKSGANLMSGVTGTFCLNSTLFGRNKKTHAVIECDEAAFRTVSRYVKPKALIVTNIFRDQLDRYGEITHTLGSIETGIRNLPDTTLVLNGDCSLTYSLAEKFPKNKIVTFGVDTPIYKGKVEEISDASYCIKCKHKYQYDYVTFGHLGGFRCPNCGYRRPVADVAAEKIILSGENSSKILLRLFQNTLETEINLPGGYNIYNACAAAAALTLMGLTKDQVTASLSGFECGFGRMEKMNIAGAEVRIILVKNPAGCNQVLNFLSDNETPTMFAVCLNDKAADGRDISWIWDVEFERLYQHRDKLKGLLVSGIRADDMALRLKYAGFSEEEVHVVKDYDEMMNRLVTQDSPVCIMPTYTAMMELRAKIAKKYGIKDFWE